MKLNIGERLRQQRMHNALTQSELAKKMEVDARTISSWETNRTEPKNYQIDLLCQILGCTVYDLTGFSNNVVMDIAAPEHNAMIELYNSLNAEQKNKVLLYMIELGMEK